MPSLQDIAKEIEENKAVNPAPHDVVRAKYLSDLSAYTNRNVIAYYSGWTELPDFLKQASPSSLSINDWDKHAFMVSMRGLDRNLGLDLILHTPGGDIAATESLVKYLRSMFGRNIRAIVPQIAMSAGTMIACACKEIVLGKHANLGPVDPQLNGVPAQAVLDEFNEAIEMIEKNPATASLWQAIIGKYHPTFLGECRRAITWSKSIVRKWLCDGMLYGDPDAKKKARKIVNALGDHSKTKTHSRHIHLDELPDVMNATELEEDDKLQELVLSIHHAFLLSCSATGILKIVENQNGLCKAEVVRMQHGPGL